LVLLSVLCDTSKARLHDVVAVQELLFSWRLDPHLELTKHKTIKPCSRLSTVRG